MPRVFEFMDVGPHFGLPAVIVNGRFAATGAAGVESSGNMRARILRVEFDKNAAHLFDVVVFADYVLVPQEVTKAKLAGFALGLSAGVKWPIFGA